MKHTRLFLCFFLTVFIQHISGQQKVLLKGIMAPNKVYKTQMANQMEMEMTLNGDSATMAEMAASGVKSPITMQIKQEILSSTKTGTQRPDKKIPLTVTYDKMSTSTTIAGNETSQPGNPFANVEIHGTTMGDGKISVDTITGSIDDAMKASLRTMVNNLQGGIKFPEKPLAIGESFEQDLPMVVPVSGVQVKMKIHVKSTLKEIKDNKAFFDMIQDISLDMNLEESKGSVSGKGNGTGVMIFDIKNKILDRTDSDIQYQMDVDMSGMKMSAKCKAKQSMIMTVE